MACPIPQPCAAPHRTSANDVEPRHLVRGFEPFRDLPGDGDRVIDWNCTAPQMLREVLVFEGDSRTLLFGLDTQFLIDAGTKVVRKIGRFLGIDPAFRFLPDTHSNYVYYASRPAEGDIWMLERDK